MTIDCSKFDPVFEKTEKIQVCSFERVNSLLERNKNDIMMLNVRTDFSIAQKSGKLSSYFTSTGVKGMLEEYKYSFIYNTFLI